MGPVSVPLAPDHLKSGRSNSVTTSPCPPPPPAEPTAQKAFQLNPHRLSSSLHAGPAYCVSNERIFHICYSNNGRECEGRRLLHSIPPNPLTVLAHQISPIFRRPLLFLILLLPLLSWSRISIALSSESESVPPPPPRHSIKSPLSLSPNVSRPLPTTLSRCP